MKSLLLLATLVTTMTINACPNLAGTYSCVDSDSDGNITNSMMTIQQQGNLFTVIDEEGTDVIVADGSIKDVEGINMSASCIGDNLVINANGSAKMDDGSIWTITAESDLTKNDRVMFVVTKAKFSSESTSTETTTVSVCTEI